MATLLRNASASTLPLPATYGGGGVRPGFSVIIADTLPNVEVNCGIRAGDGIYLSQTADGQPGALPIVSPGVGTGGLAMAVASTNPAVPASGTLLAYARKVAGRPALMSEGALGNLPSLFAPIPMNKYAQWYKCDDAVPALREVYTGKVQGVEGSGSQSNIAPDSVSLLTSSDRVRFNASATSFSYTGWIGGKAATVQNRFQVGSAAVPGGFFCFHRFALIAQTAVPTGAFGMFSGTAFATPPATGMSNFIGIACDAGDAGAWQFVRRPGTGTAVKVPITLVNNVMYDLYLYMAPGVNGANTLFVRISSWGVDANGLPVETIILDTSYTTSLPVAGLLMSPVQILGAGSSGFVASNFDCLGCYVESDF